MSMLFAGYNPALGSTTSASNVGANRETASTVNANSTAQLGGSVNHIVLKAGTAIVIALVLLVLGRFLLANVRIG